MIDRNVPKKGTAHRGMRLNHNETLVHEKETIGRPNRLVLSLHF
jgi:hypothetical protein